MGSLISSVKTLWREPEGQDLIEYSLLLAFIALGAVALLSHAGSSVKTLWQAVIGALINATTAAS